MAGEEDFYENYLLLKAEEASCLDLLRILCSNNLDKRDFFNSRVDLGLSGFRHRWIVFVSVLVQKVFLYLKKPTAAVGLAVETVLNYPASNGGYRRLFFNLLAGKLVRPDKSSSNFISVTGHLDQRLTLDRSNEIISSNYNAALAVMASKLSYENHSFVRNVVTHHWQMELLEFYSFWNDYQNLETTHAILFQDKTVNPNLITVAFRGTDPFNADEWRTDADISWYKFKGVGRIHGGFMKALGMQKSEGWPKEIAPTRKSYAYYTIREKLKTLIQENETSKFIVTGHSLGGALAILFASVLAIHEEESLLQKLEGVYTFGQPRVGDERFGEYMKVKMKAYDVKYFRFVYCNDVVTRLPYDDETFLFKHFGPSLYFNSCYRGEVLGEEPNKNYFSVLYVLPKILNAVYQLIRSFILPRIKGEEYKEGWFMRLFRLTALVLPGLTDHFPYDYVNATRLGRLPSSAYPEEPSQNIKTD